MLEVTSEHGIHLLVMYQILKPTKLSYKCKASKKVKCTAIAHTSAFFCGPCCNTHYDRIIRQFAAQTVVKRCLMDKKKVSTQVCHTSKYF